MELDFIYCQDEKKIQKVCAAWEKGKLGKATIKRGKKHISLEWDYPKSFRPYDLQLIRQNCRYRFSEVNEHEFYDLDINKDDQICRMIINAFGW